MDQQKTPSDRIALYKAFAEAKKAMAPIVRSKRGGQGKYVPLDQLIDVVDAALEANGLFQIQPLQSFADGTAYIETMICHAESGECIVSQFPVTPGEPSRTMNSHQALGSAITYSRRYALQNVCGIAPEDDDDAQSAGAPRREQRPAAPAQQSQPPASKPATSLEAWDKKIRDTLASVGEAGFQQLGIDAARAFQDAQGNAWMMHGLIKMAPSDRVLEYLLGLCKKVEMTGDYMSGIKERSESLAQVQSEGGFQ